MTFDPYVLAVVVDGGPLWVSLAYWIVLAVQVRMLAGAR
jgi:hypothetical protein